MSFMCVSVSTCKSIYICVFFCDGRQFTLELKWDLKLYTPFKISVVVHNCSKLSGYKLGGVSVH